MTRAMARTTYVWDSCMMVAVANPLNERTSFTYTFDSLNRLATAMKPGNQLYTMAYDADSRRTTMQLGLGTTRQYQFDNRGQLTTQIELNGATQICTIVDGYDPVGNRVTRSLDGNPATWTYDDLYRLTGQAKAGQVCTYTLDGVGNLKTMWEGGNFPKTFTHNAADRLVTMVEGANLTTYAWTGYGALESEITGTSTTTNTYSGQDQLIGVVEPDGKLSTYTFDGDGLRRTTREDRTTGATSMVWDGSDYLYLKKPGLNQSQVVLTLDSEIVACGTKDLLTDPLGSLVKEISAGASLGNLIEMYPYGSLVNGTGTPTTPYVYIAAYGYFKDNADRDYVRAREFLKKLARWMQVDPWWPAAKPYSYVGSNPLALVDPGGLQSGKPSKKLPKTLADCLSAKAEKILADKLKDKKCDAAIRKLCGKSGIDALNDPSIVPTYSIEDDCIPRTPVIETGSCRVQLPGAGPGPWPVGTPCVVVKICLSRDLCHGTGPFKGHPKLDELQACAVLWELGNACYCKNKGYNPVEEGGIGIAKACGCSSLVSPGGGWIR